MTKPDDLQPDTEQPPVLEFSLSRFKADVEELKKLSGNTRYSTMSHWLFGDSRRLPSIMDTTVPDHEKTYPGLQTCVAAHEIVRRRIAEARQAGKAAKRHGR